MAELNSFLTRIKKLCAQEDGPGLSRLLALPVTSTISAATRDLAQRAGEQHNVQAYCAMNLQLDLEVDIASVVGYYLSALSALLKGEYATAVEQHTVRMYSHDTIYEELIYKIKKNAKICSIFLSVLTRLF
jgi:hypothetical protein